MAHDAFHGRPPANLPGIELETWIERPDKPVLVRADCRTVHRVEIRNYHLYRIEASVHVQSGGRVERCQGGGSTKADEWGCDRLAIPAAPFASVQKYGTNSCDTEVRSVT